jgi:radical SAM superfamily enzyme YgiQ (UPF0313 family)
MKLLLIYPQLGALDGFARDIPLSIIYAASHSVKKGHAARLLDLRNVHGGWRDSVLEELGKGYGLIGLSVMTGLPIKQSVEISKFIKEKTDIPIIWGGAHPTILPEQTLREPYIDYVIRDWGSVALCGLADYLETGSPARESILGLGYKENGECKFSPPQTSFEMIPWQDLPYDLVDFAHANYSRLSGSVKTFPIFTAMGCPYKCAFCMSPAVYHKISGKKWVAYDMDYIFGHIEYLASRYDFDAIQILDDDSFVDLERMRDFLKEFIRRGHNKRFRIEFRGGRVNELDRMDDEMFSLLREAGTQQILIGVESGSERSLLAMKKGISVEQILRVNRKFARFPSLKPTYNFMFGIPGETLADVLQTKDLILQIIAEHPDCFINFSGIWKPMPGAELTDLAVSDYNLKLPETLEEWAAVDSFDAEPLNYPWFSPKMAASINLISLAAVMLDGKIRYYSPAFGPVLSPLLRLIQKMYRPMLLWRLKGDRTAFLLEYRVWQFAFRKLRSIARLGRFFQKKAQSYYAASIESGRT